MRRLYTAKDVRCKVGAMSAEELLREAQYAFQCISFGDTRDNRKNASRATRYAKKIIRKYPTSSEARQANDLLIRLGNEHYAQQFRQQHRTHSPSETLHDHSDLKRRPSVVVSLEDYSSEPIAWSTLWNGVLGLKANFLVMGATIVFFFVLIFGFFLPIVAFAFFALMRPLSKQNSPEARTARNRLMQLANAWLQKNQRST